MSTPRILAALRPLLDGALAADPWGQGLTVHDDPGRAAPRLPGGWVALRLQLDHETVPRRGLDHLAIETDGRLVVVLYQPATRPADELTALGDSIVSRFRGQCVEGIVIDFILPGSTVASGEHRGYRERVVVVGFTARSVEDWHHE